MSFSLSQTQMPVCHHDVNMLTSSPSKVTAHLRSWNIYFFLFPKSQSSDVYQYYICLSLFLCTLTDVTLETLWEQTVQGFPSPTLFICTSILSCILQLKTRSHCPLSSSLFLLELHPLTQNTSNVFGTDSLQGTFMCFTGGMNAKTCSVPQKCIYLNDLLSEKKKIQQVWKRADRELHLECSSAYLWSPDSYHKCIYSGIYNTSKIAWHAHFVHVYYLLKNRAGGGVLNGREVVSNHSILTAYVFLQFTANATIFTQTHSNDSHCTMTRLNNIDWLFSFCCVMTLIMGFHKHVFNKMYQNRLHKYIKLSQQGVIQYKMSR